MIFEVLKCLLIVAGGLWINAVLIAAHNDDTQENYIKECKK